MSVITLQFSYQPALASELIVYFGHGAGYSHVDSVNPDGTLWGARHDSVGGKPPGYQIRPNGYLPFTKILRVDLPATDLQVQQFWDFAKQQIGKPYDTDAILGFAAGRNWRDANAWVCSEEVGADLEACRWFEWPLSTPDNKLDPDDLLLAISAKVDIKL